MSNGSPAVAAAAGGGIAYLRRQFELRIDAVCEAPMKPPPVRKRPVSFLDPKTVVLAKPLPTEPVHPPTKPKLREATSISELASSPCHAPSTSFSSSLSSSHSSLSVSLSSSNPATDPAAGSTQATPQVENNGHLDEIKEIRDEVTANDLVGHSKETDMTTTPELHPSDVTAPKYLHESAAELTETEDNDKTRTKDISLKSDRTNETDTDRSCLTANAGEFNIINIPASIPTELDSLNGVGETASKERDGQSSKPMESRLPKETLIAQKSPHVKTPLSHSATPKTKWMPVTRSLENLCSDSASTPSKEVNAFCGTKPNAIKVLQAATAADVVTTSQSLDRSTSLANKAKPPVRAKKTPPPVPKKNVKFAEPPKPCRGMADEKKSDSNSGIKLSLEEVNVSIPSEAKLVSEGDQSQLSVPRRVAAAAATAAQTKVQRPNSLFPPMETLVLRHTAESNHDRYMSLPTLNHLLANGGSSPLYNRKDTLFPCNRQKLRPMVSPLSSHTSTALTPDFCQHRLIGEDQALLASPMSLGNRTPPGFDSMVANTGERVDVGHQPPHRTSHCSLLSPLQSPVDPEICLAGNVKPDSVLPSPSPDGEIIGAASAAEVQQVSVINQFSDVSDADSFLEDAFEFLGPEAQPIEERMNTSSLKLWTDTWCKTSPKNHTEIPRRASKLNDSQKDDEQSTKDNHITDQNRNEMKSKLQTAAKIEEDKERTTEGKQGVRRRGSFAPGGSDRKATDDAKDADIERPKLFGVVLRPNSICSLSRRSTFLSANPAPGASSSSTASSSAAAASESNRRSGGILLRTSSVARPPSRLPSLTILPSNRPAAKVPGKYIGGKPSVLLDSTSSTQEDKKTDLDTELDAIDKAFDFLDGSGA